MQSRVHKVIAVLLVAVAAAASSCSARLATNTGPPPPTMTRSSPTQQPVQQYIERLDGENIQDDARSLDEFMVVSNGRYEVGAQVVAITDDARARTLMTTVWFPTDDIGKAKPYSYEVFPSTYIEASNAQEVDASTISLDGPFPLVVLSHRSAGSRLWYTSYAETLASHGLIVAAPDHASDTFGDDLAGTTDDYRIVLVNRPADVSTVIDALTDTSNHTSHHPDHTVFAASIDPDRIAVTGDSAVGTTSFAAVSGFENEFGRAAGDHREGGRRSCSCDTAAERSRACVGRRTDNRHLRNRRRR